MKNTKKKKVKPTPKKGLWMFSPYWWNPLFWTIFILYPFINFGIEGIKGFIDGEKDTWGSLKNIDLS